MAGRGNASSAEGPPADRDGEQFSRLFLLLIGAVTLIGLAVRIPSMDDGMLGDELSTYFVVDGRGLGSLLDVVVTGQEATPPAYFLFARLTEWIGDPWVGLRMPSLIAGVATIPLTYMLGVRTIGRPAAIVGACLVALSPFLIFYSTEARAYSLSMLFDLLSTLALLRALEDGRTRWWVGYAACTTAAMYTHYTAIFVLVAQFAWAFLGRPEARRTLVLANVAAVIAWLPWIPGYRDDSKPPLNNLIELVQPFTWEAVKYDLAHWAVLHPSLPRVDLPGDFFVLLIEAGLVLGALGLVLRLVHTPRAQWRPSAGITLVVILAAAVPVLGGLYSLAVTSVYLPRNLITSSPGLALAVGALLMAGRNWIRIPAVALVLAGFAAGAIKLTDADYQRPDYPAAAAFIKSSAEPGDPIVDQPLLSSGVQSPLHAALGSPSEDHPGGHPVYELGNPTLKVLREALGPDGRGPFFPPLPVPPTETLTRKAVRAAGDGNLYLVLLGAGTLEEARLFPGPVTDFLEGLPPGFREIEMRTFPGFGFFKVTVHVLRRDTPSPSSNAEAQ